jgi:hypothetical protein
MPSDIQGSVKPTLRGVSECQDPKVNQIILATTSLSRENCEHGYSSSYGTLLFKEDGQENTLPFFTRISCARTDPCKQKKAPKRTNRKLQEEIYHNNIR